MKFASMAFKEVKTHDSSVQRTESFVRYNNVTFGAHLVRIIHCHHCRK
jgi:hypothetical protein